MGIPSAFNSEPITHHRCRLFAESADAQMRRFIGEVPDRRVLSICESSHL